MDWWMLLESHWPPIPRLVSIPQTLALASMTELLKYFPVVS